MLTAKQRAQYDAVLLALYLRHALKWPNDKIRAWIVEQFPELVVVK